MNTTKTNGGKIIAEPVGIFRKALEDRGQPAAWAFIILFYLFLRIAAFRNPTLAWALEDGVELLRQYAISANVVAFVGVLLISALERMVIDMFLFDDRKRQRMEEEHAAAMAEQAAEKAAQAAEIEKQNKEIAWLRAELHRRDNGQHVRGRNSLTSPRS